MNQSFTISEYEIQESLCTHLNLLPHSEFWVNPQAGYYDSKIKSFRKHKSKYTKSGASDILGFHKGVFCSIEVKTEKEYKYTMKHIEEIYKSPLFLLNKKKMHLWKQRDFIEMVIRNKGKGGFACTFEHCLNILNQ